MDGLIDLIQSPWNGGLAEQVQGCIQRAVQREGWPLPERAQRFAAPRVPEFKGDVGVPFGALIHPSNPDSGPYGGMSFVVFPAPTFRAWSP